MSKKAGNSWRPYQEAKARSGLFQKQVAKPIGVDEDTIYRWESNETQPQARQTRKIVKFLGYNPLPAPLAPSDRS